MLTDRQNVPLCPQRRDENVNYCPAIRQTRGTAILELDKSLPSSLPPSALPPSSHPLSLSPPLSHSAHFPHSALVFAPIAARAHYSKQNVRERANSRAAEAVAARENKGRP